MRIRDRTDTSTAILLVGVAVLSAWWGHGLPRPKLPMPVQEVLPAQGTTARAKFEWCREHVALVHDLYWASACGRMTGDDSPDCTLPNEQAGRLNAARASAERQCLEEARAAGGASEN